MLEQVTQELNKVVETMPSKDVLEGQVWTQVKTSDIGRAALTSSFK